MCGGVSLSHYAPTWGSSAVLDCTERELPRNYIDPIGYHDQQVNVILRDNDLFAARRNNALHRNVTVSKCIDTTTVLHYFMRSAQ